MLQQLRCVKESKACLRGLFFTDTFNKHIAVGKLKLHPEALVRILIVDFSLGPVLV